MKTEWCLSTPITYWGNHSCFSSSAGDKRRIAPRYVVCPNCKGRFKPRIDTCGDVMGKDDRGHIRKCWHVYIPAHKQKIKIKRKTSRESRVRRR